MRKVRVIKKEGMFYPQYLKVSFICKAKRWCFFEYTEPEIICYSYAYECVFKEKFKTKQEARDFLRKAGYRL